MTMLFLCNSLHEALELISKGKPCIVGDKIPVAENRTHKGPETKSAIERLQPVTENQVPENIRECTILRFASKNRRGTGTNFKIMPAVLADQIVESNR